MNMFMIKMGIGFIYRTIRASAVLACIIFLAVWLYYDFKFAGGILIGAGWGCLNLFAILLVVKAMIAPERAKKRAILLILFLKFPLVYFIGYVILRLGYFPILSLLAGFTLIFLVMVLKALGQMLTSTENKRELENSIKE